MSSLEQVHGTNQNFKSNNFCILKRTSWQYYCIFRLNTSISMSSKIFVKIHAVLRKLHMIKHMTTLTMCPMTHVSHPPRYPISIFSINHDTHLPTFPIAHMSKKVSSCQKDVKLSKRCQVVKKMSNVKKSNTLTMEEVYKINKFT